MNKKIEEKEKGVEEVRTPLTFEVDKPEGVDEAFEVSKKRREETAKILQTLDVEGILPSPVFQWEIDDAIAIRYGRGEQQRRYRRT